jgi:hypothetical protein
VTFLVGGAFFWFLFPLAFPNVALISGIACGLYMLVLPLWFLFWERVVLFAYWLVPPVVRVSSTGIDVFFPGQKPLQVTMESLDLLIVHSETPTRRSITVKWRDGECTVGIPPRLNLCRLREVVGEKYREAIRIVS